MASTPPWAPTQGPPPRYGPGGSPPVPLADGGRFFSLPGAAGVAGGGGQWGTCAVSLTHGQMRESWRAGLHNGPPAAGFAFCSLTWEHLAPHSP